MILKERPTLLLEGGLDEAAEHAEHPREQHRQVHLGLHHIDGRVHALTHGGNAEVQLIPRPPRLHVSAARDVLLQLVDIVGDAPPGLVLAEIVGQVDVDGLSHLRDVGRRSALFKPMHRSMILLMKLTFAPLVLIATAAAAQPAPVTQPSPAQPMQATAPWDPAAPYITVGQDEPGYRSWYLAAPWRAPQVKSFNDYLVANQVGGILPTWQLLRTATSWKDCGQQPFEVPPADEWPNMVQTLRYIRDYVVPAVGPVEPVSVYRNPALNVCAGGAPESAHKLDSAVDLVPLRPTDRVTLMRTLCGVHSEHGAAYNAGLGFYAYLRFHIDSTKYRRWNMDPAVAAECPPILHPEDIASVGQPLPPAPSATPVASSPNPPAVSPQSAPTAATIPPQGTPAGQPH